MSLIKASVPFCVVDGPQAVSIPSSCSTLSYTPIEVCVFSDANGSIGTSTFVSVQLCLCSVSEMSPAIPTQRHSRQRGLVMQDAIWQSVLLKTY